MSVIDSNWDYHKEDSILEHKLYIAFESKVLSFIQNLETGFKSETFQNSINSSENQEHELKTLVEINKRLRGEIEKKQQQCTAQKSHYDALKKDQKVLTREIKNTHEAFLMAKKYYKRHLKMYYTLDPKADKNQTVFVQFFTETKKESNNFSVSLCRNKDNRSYEILATNPQLCNLKEIQRNLQESNDVPGALCCIRQAFSELQLNKN